MDQILCWAVSKVGPVVLDTRIQPPPYPDLNNGSGYVSQVYPGRIRIRCVPDTGYAPPERIRAGQVNSALDLGIKHFSCFQLVFLLGYFHPGK
jgi:hypothetical protein